MVEALACWLLAAAVWDAGWRRLPNALMLVGAFAAAFSILPSPALAGWGGPRDPLQALAWAAGGLAVSLPFHLLGRMGAGDVKMLAVLGAWIGPLLLPVWLIGTLSQGVHALIRVLRRARPLPGRERLPFGTHLGAAGLLVLAARALQA
ncbi:prepilin peptidase [Aquariibacter albus]|uniref:Prepilin peptidase n=1 Tax=Aquariibacter albus TaxID=2759899 RepID=A0A839HLE2_9BURK|nr:prepilin peptidase [Aquariibacter albus]MBB1162092.1 prepilin peptidase [Aquariibacter albus]